jgi:predicted aspartyl protease
MKDALKSWLITTNLALMTVMPTMIFLSSSQRVIAEDPGGCFMVTSSGKTISLRKLCGAIIVKSEIAQIPQTVNIPKQEIPPIPQAVTISNSKILQIPHYVNIADERITRIPIKRRIGNTPVIEVTFNHKQTFEMILDTGANGTLITRKMANKLKVRATGIMQAQVADGSEVRFLTGKVKSIAVGGVTAKNLPVAIAPKAGIGLLGHDFFGDCNIRLGEKEVEFQRR